MTPLVSIIIPTYNRAHLIEETLNSVVAQTYANWECIVVDDGSTDETSSIMSQYCAKDKRFRYYHRPEDRLPGGNAARNYGFEQSKGAYINYLDSDDHLYYRALEIKVGKTNKYECDVVISKHTKSKNNLGVYNNVDEVFFSNSFDITFIKLRNSILIGDPFFKRKLMKNIRFDERLKRGQDHDFYIRLFRQKINYCMISHTLYLINVTSKSITVKAGLGDSIMIDTQIQIHKKMLSYYINEPSVVYEYERKTVKMYKSLMKKKRVIPVIKNYHFYRKCFKLNVIEFTFYFLVNFIMNKGYDKLKYKIR